MQTKKQSLVEVCTGTLVGGVGSWAITVTVLWLAEVMDFAQHKGVVAACSVAACTVWSLVRGYWLRRHFNHRHQRADLRTD